MCVTCVLTVVSLMKSSCAISAFDSPRATSRNTSCSRELRSASCFDGVGRATRVNCRMTRFVTVGDRSASPAATVRIAAINCSGGSSLRTKPLAPAFNASYMYSSRSKVVRIRTRAAGSAARMRRVACRPSSSGIRMSIRTTVGWNRAALLTASSPFLASATTSMSSSPSSSNRKPARTIDWSSATRTPIVMACRRLRGVVGCAGRNRRPLRVLRSFLPRRSSRVPECR